MVRRAALLLRALPGSTAVFPSRATTRAGEKATRPGGEARALLCCLVLLLLCAIGRVVPSVPVVGVTRCAEGGVQLGGTWAFVRTRPVD